MRASPLPAGMDSNVSRGIPIAISGIGVVSRLGVGWRSCWDRLSTVPVDDLFPAHGALGTVPDMDAEAILGRDMRRAGRISQYAQVAMHEALEDARIPGDPFRQEGSVILATTHGPIEFSEAFHRDLVLEGPERSNPALFSESLPSVPTTHLTLLTGLQGAATTLIGDGTAFYDTIRLAVGMLRFGQYRWVACAAAEESTSLVFQGYRSCGGWLSRTLRGQSSKGASPDVSSGLAEGATVLILERLDEVHGRGGSPHAVFDEVGSWVGVSWEQAPSLIESAKGVNAVLLGGHPRAPMLPGEERFLEAVLGDAPVGVSAIRPLLGEGFEFTTALQVAWGALSLRHGTLSPAVARHSLRSSNVARDRPSLWKGRVRRLLCVTGSSREAMGSCVLVGERP